jgi:hypothetical protein
MRHNFYKGSEFGTGWGWVRIVVALGKGHSAKMSFYSGILYAKFFFCGVSQAELPAGKAPAVKLN